jgi:hypothetical protein
VSRVERPDGFTAEPAIRPRSALRTWTGFFSVSTSDKPQDLRRTAKHSVPAVPTPLRRGADKRVARRIGSGQHKAALPGAETMGAGATGQMMPGQVMRGQVIKLSWADTFGRPARPDFGRLFRSDPVTAQVLPFRTR